VQPRVALDIDRVGEPGIVGGKRQQLDVAVRRREPGKLAALEIEPCEAMKRPAAIGSTIA
jgi:hypothetical protein